MARTSGDRLQAWTSWTSSTEPRPTMASTRSATTRPGGVDSRSMSVVSPTRRTAWKAMRAAMTRDTAGSSHWKPPVDRITTAVTATLADVAASPTMWRAADRMLRS